MASQDVPWLSDAYPFAAERAFNAMPYVYFAERYFWVAIVICVAYLVSGVVPSESG